MTGDRREDVYSRLEGLASDLQKVYPQAGDKVTQAIARADELIRKIGVPLNCAHYAESLRECVGRGYAASAAPLHAPAHRFQFAYEGNEEFALCAARGRDGAYGLYVSHCSYKEWDATSEDRDGNDQVEQRMTVETDIISPAELPLPLRVRILDVLDEFLAAYEENVRRTRAKLLNGTYVPKPSQ